MGEPKRRFVNHICFTAQVFNYNLNLPSVDSTQVLVKVSGQDRAGNSASTTSSTFTVDSTAPTISSFVLAGGSTSVAFPSVAYAINASDSLTSVSAIKFSESSTFVDSGWLAYGASGTTSLSAISGAKTIYVWVKDVAGNISNSASYAISLDYGSPPTVTITSPISSGTSYSAGQNVAVQWSCSSSNGLDSLPVRIRYTTDDGVTFANASAWTANNLSSTTGSFDWALPTGVTVFRLLVECKSAAGVVASAYSKPMNTSTWTVYAGDPAQMSENVSATVALMTNGGSGWQQMAADAGGSIFFVKGNALMRVDSQTGLVTRFAGDPLNGGCTMTAGQDPLAAGYDRIGSSAVLYGTDSAHTSILIGTCGKIWSLNTTTRALSVIYSSASYVGMSGAPWYFSRTGYLYAINSSYQLYRLNLNVVNATQQFVAGNGSCSPTLAATGTAADSSPMPSDMAGNCVGETYILTNADDSKIFVGCWNGVAGCGNSGRFDWDSAQNKYVVGAQTVSWGFSDGDKPNCVPSYTSNRVWCNSRYNTNYRTFFDTSTETWTKTSISPQQFLRYASTPSGMVSLSSLNILNSYIENSGASVTVVQLGGSNITTYGNGSDLSKVAFSDITDITYSSGVDRLFISNSTAMREIQRSPMLIKTQTSFSGAYQVTANQAGNKFLTMYDCSGQLYLRDTYNLSTFTQDADIMRRNVCGTSTFDTTYPVADGSAATTRVPWVLDTTRRPLAHSNGKAYFYVTSSGNASNGFIYSSDGTTLKMVAGTTGATSYVASENGTLALGAHLSNVRTIQQIPTTNPYSGDLLLVDGDRLRLVTITTESSNPKIYDVGALTLATSYASGTANSMADVVYDFGSEAQSGGQGILGTGTLYYSTTARAVHRWKASSMSGNIVSAATDTTYAFAGTSFTGTLRLAITPDGLLVTQSNKNRILRVDP